MGLCTSDTKDIERKQFFERWSNVAKQFSNTIKYNSNITHMILPNIYEKIVRKALLTNQRLSLSYLTEEIGFNKQQSYYDVLTSSRNDKWTNEIYSINQSEYEIIFTPTGFGLAFICLFEIHLLSPEP